MSRVTHTIVQSQWFWVQNLTSQVRIIDINVQSAALRPHFSCTWLCSSTISRYTRWQRYCVPAYCVLRACKYLCPRWAVSNWCRGSTRWLAWQLPSTTLMRARLERCRRMFFKGEWRCAYHWCFLVPCSLLTTEMLVWHVVTCTEIWSHTALLDNLKIFIWERKDKLYDKAATICFCYTDQAWIKTPKFCWYSGHGLHIVTTCFVKIPDFRHINRTQNCDLIFIDNMNFTIE